MNMSQPISVIKDQVLAWICHDFQDESLIADLKVMSTSDEFQQLIEEGKLSQEDKELIYSEIKQRE